ncbi:trigger factor [Butyrivibrio sp. YAB3001]|uniref:trigger factor n=1 Tax=Butyrivibrio sp. YAB3001 TaxID=1520812 RepID=UPI0008F62123|nr:trigger factor [Butyrivibrio sp. YAB3001]SFC08730.1 trigger factor [Butyrivibrio sp. YAB3001]
MKKKLSVLLAGVMVCTLFTACSKEAANSDTAATENASAQESTTTETSTDETASAITIDFDNLATMALKDVKASDYVTLGQYDGITVEASLKEITDEDVTSYIENIKASNPPMVEVTDRAVQDGDTVNIDYVGKFADTLEAFDGGTAQGASLKIGSNSYIEGFESGLVGVEKGQTVDLNLTFPEDYGAENLAGKAVVFTVTVNSINTEAEDITDDWAAGLGLDGVTNLEELKKYALDTLNSNAKDEYDTTVENAVITTLSDSSTFSEAPQELVNRYIKQQDQMLEYRANLYSYYYGQQLSATDIVNMMMQSEGFTGTADEYLNSISTDTTNQYLMFQAIADELGIEVSEQEIDDYLKNAYESASSTGFSTYEEYKASLDLEVYREGLMAEKVVGYMVDHANVVEATSDSASN